MISSKVEELGVRDRKSIARRGFLTLAGTVVLGLSRLSLGLSAMASEPVRSLLTAPLELGGAWTGSLPGAARRVISRMREVCLAGVRLVSDRQPAELYVDDHSSGPPAIWLHSDHPETAWIIVDIGPRDWCKLSYQFGHELGHVLSNSWQVNSKPRPPCQWLEESIVEAFSIRGLGRLADSWEQSPPLAGDAAFSASIRSYRDNVIKDYGCAGGPVSDPEIALWFRGSRSQLESDGPRQLQGPFIVRMAAELERDIGCVEDLGALNRWPGRTGVALKGYLARWKKSCTQVHSAGHLPTLIGKLLDIK